MAGNNQSSSSKPFHFTKLSSACRKEFLRSELNFAFFGFIQFDKPKPRGNRNFQRWVFRAYDFNVVRLWSSWLVHVSTDEIDFAPANMTKLHLDTLDEKIAEFLPSFDVVVVASGHWWPKTAAYIVDGKVVGGQSWWNSSSPKQHDVLSGYSVAMKTALKAILATPNYK